MHLAEENVAANGVTNVQVARLSAEEFREATMLPGYHPSQVARLSA